VTPLFILGTCAAYFALLLGIAHVTGRRASMSDFALGGRRSPWYVVAFGMIGTSLSGVTFISVPGWVESQGFGYMQMVLGYLVGYGVIIAVLLPLYYRLQLTSIYSFLGERIGPRAYKTGAAFFLLSRTMGAAFRLFLVALVFHEVVLAPWGPTTGLWGELRFAGLVALTIAMIWVYTRRGGIATLVWTDALQTFFMLGAAGLAVVLIGQSLGASILEIPALVVDSGMSRWLFLDDFSSAQNGVKMFVAGAFVAIAMTGLDQDMMQKNLSCRSLRQAQLNMGSFAIVLVFVNMLFLALGALLYMYADAQGITIERADLLFPTVALESGLGIALGLAFILGLIAAAYSSADSALTALTTSVCVDFLGMDEAPAEHQVAGQRRVRTRVHLLVSLGVAAAILIFRAVNDTSVIAALFTVASYTYGPLLGLFAWALLGKSSPATDRWAPYIAMAAPVLGYLIQLAAKSTGFDFGFALLPVNGLLAWAGLFLASKWVGTRSESR
jgi:SSS family solute:Na+ symporter